jgi:hypothetical protein
MVYGVDDRHRTVVARDIDPRSSAVTIVRFGSTPTGIFATM